MRAHDIRIKTSLRKNAKTAKQNVKITRPLTWLVPHQNLCACCVYFFDAIYSVATLARAMFLGNSNKSDDMTVPQPRWADLTDDEEPDLTGEPFSRPQRWLLCNPSSRGAETMHRSCSVSTVPKEHWEQPQQQQQQQQQQQLQQQLQHQPMLPKQMSIQLAKVCEFPLILKRDESWQAVVEPEVVGKTFHRAEGLFCVHLWEPSMTHINSF